MLALAVDDALPARVRVASGGGDCGGTLRLRTVPWPLRRAEDWPCMLLVRCLLVGFGLAWLELLELTEVDESEASPLA